MNAGLTLVFDTSGPWIAAGLASNGRLLHAATETMARGQAERLIPLLEELLTATGTRWAELTAIGVGTGPGNFTGTRIAVATARGLSLALGIPAHPITAFEMALAPPTSLVLLEAPRGRAYAQRFADGRAAGPPEVVDPATLGPDAPPVRAAAPPSPAAMARLLHARLSAGAAPDRPAPLYIRPADAAPPSDPPPVILP
ncbi:tRNA (adenosine(37)-N6)-threonylcarbamoyltransferase complex dimerization subunit type 1 TsaB [Histidinibacterium lentulum]|uniref:tRNA (Adenosine(37)-N6)-threonylcarbamoyltransferase complex dimerization subunit type 1 TsaB n=1 Tax=Histidinibacterium lentulum TaxID=2480588 RepID=A0A3N2R1E7_9RHOB|nr:tRNA (adenosine(37)-N6)-threonylcarbamoyltransferase complex dimerization subunit type 1 TsaB [Histidinibacterium lentulum]ROU01126.1 tRNA (adenosine(37)-N6)-threonylcarbamoyltransferase complex dimerization subunit type 1 TsaB [Histidinibacterium lentulum]